MIGAEYPWDFDIERVPVLYRPIGSANIAPFPDRDCLLGVSKNGTKWPIAVVSRDYTVVKHRDVVDIVRNTIEALNIPAIESIETKDKGAVMYAWWSIRKFDVRNGDPVNIGVRLVNSVNSTVRLIIEYFGMRQVCSNGLTVPAKVGGFTRKHVGEIQLADLPAMVRAGVENIHRVSNLFQTSANSWLSVVEATATIDRTGLPELYREIAKSDIRVIADRNNQQVTRWDLYNAITRAISQRARDGKIQLDRKRDMELIAYNTVLAPLATVAT